MVQTRSATAGARSRRDGVSPPKFATGRRLRSSAIAEPRDEISRAGVGTVVRAHGFQLVTEAAAAAAVSPNSLDSFQIPGVSVPNTQAPTRRERPQAAAYVEDPDAQTMGRLLRQHVVPSQMKFDSLAMLPPQDKSSDRPMRAVAPQANNSGTAPMDAFQTRWTRAQQVQKSIADPVGDPPMGACCRGIGHVYDECTSLRKHQLSKRDRGSSFNQDMVCWRMREDITQGPEQGDNQSPQDVSEQELQDKLVAIRRDIEDPPQRPYGCSLGASGAYGHTVGADQGITSVSELHLSQLTDAQSRQPSSNAPTFRHRRSKKDLERIIASKIFVHSQREQSMNGSAHSSSNQPPARRSSFSMSDGDSIQSSGIHYSQFSNSESTDDGNGYCRSSLPRMNSPSSKSGFLQQLSRPQHQQGQRFRPSELLSVRGQEKVQLPRFPELLLLHEREQRQRNTSPKVCSFSSESSCQHINLSDYRKRRPDVPSPVSSFDMQSQFQDPRVVPPFLHCNGAPSEPFHSVAHNTATARQGACSSSEVGDARRAVQCDLTPSKFCDYGYYLNGGEEVNPPPQDETPRFQSSPQVPPIASRGRQRFRRRILPGMLPAIGEVPMEYPLPPEHKLMNRVNYRSVPFPEYRQDGPIASASFRSQPPRSLPPPPPKRNRGWPAPDLRVVRIPAGPGDDSNRITKDSILQYGLEGHVVPIFTYQCMPDVSTPYKGIGSFNQWRRKFELACQNFHHLSSESRARQMASRFEGIAEEWYIYLADRYGEEVFDYHFLVTEFHREFDDKRPESVRLDKCRELVCDEAESVRSFAQRFRVEWQKELSKKVPHNLMLAKLMAEAFLQGVPNKVQMVIAASPATTLEEMIAVAIKFEEKLDSPNGKYVGAEEKSAARNSPVAAGEAGHPALSSSSRQLLAALVEATAQLSLAAENLVASNKATEQRHGAIEQRLFNNALTDAIAGTETVIRLAQVPAVSTCLASNATSVNSTDIRAPTAMVQSYNIHPPGAIIPLATGNPPLNVAPPMSSETTSYRIPQPNPSNSHIYNGPFPNRYCWVCNRIGHWYRDCWHLNESLANGPDNLNRGGGNTRGRNRGGNSRANFNNRASFRRGTSLNRGNSGDNRGGSRGSHGGPWSSANRYHFGTGRVFGADDLTSATTIAPTTTVAAVSLGGASSATISAMLLSPAPTRPTRHPPINSSGSRSYPHLGCLSSTAGKLPDVGDSSSPLSGHRHATSSDEMMLETRKSDIYTSIHYCRNASGQFLISTPKLSSPIQNSGGPSSYQDAQAPSVFWKELEINPLGPHLDPSNTYQLGNSHAGFDLGMGSRNSRTGPNSGNRLRNSRAGLEVASGLANCSAAKKKPPVLKIPFSMLTTPVTSITTIVSAISSTISTSTVSSPACSALDTLVKPIEGIVANPTAPGCTPGFSSGAPRTFPSCTLNMDIPPTATQASKSIARRILIKQRGTRRRSSSSSSSLSDSVASDPAFGAVKDESNQDSRNVSVETSSPRGAQLGKTHSSAANAPPRRILKLTKRRKTPRSPMSEQRRLDLRRQLYGLRTPTVELNSALDDDEDVRDSRLASVVSDDSKLPLEN